MYWCRTQKYVQGEHAMYRYQFGYFSRQTSLLLALFGLVLAFAIPKLNDFSDRNKVTEAYHLASESKLRLDEFYKLSARFPSSETEVKSVTTSMFRQPDFVSAIEVDHVDDEFDIVVRVFLKEDVFNNETGDIQYIYMAGNKSARPGLGLDWSCGASGLEDHLLPNDCSS
jgi:type II secretory pathway pseudopilin PulG